MIGNWRMPAGMIPVFSQLRGCVGGHPLRHAIKGTSYTHFIVFIFYACVLYEISPDSNIWYSVTSVPREA